MEAGTALRISVSELSFNEYSWKVKFLEKIVSNLSTKEYYQSSWKETAFLVSKYLFKVNKNNTRTTSIKAVLASLLFTLNRDLPTGFLP